MSFVEIHTFDDGNAIHEQETNQWEVVDSMFTGGKLKLRNIKSGTIISSISAWKTIRSS